MKNSPNQPTTKNSNKGLGLCAGDQRMVEGMSKAELKHRYDFVQTHWQLGGSQLTSYWERWKQALAQEMAAREAAFANVAALVAYARMRLERSPILASYTDMLMGPDIPEVGHSPEWASYERCLTQYVLQNEADIFHAIPSTGLTNFAEMAYCLLTK